MHIAPRPHRARGIPALFARIGLSVILLAVAAAPAHAAPAAHVAQVVAAENFYGALIQQLGGPQVSVTSVLSNADQDPHSFEASPKIARALARADLVVYNGAAYDPWMTPLLKASTHVGRTEIVAAALLGTPAGANPHLWYEPRTMPALARAVAAYLSARDPAHAADYRQRLADFLAAMQPVAAKIASLREKYRGTKVSATEPVFGYMAEAIGLDMQNERFQMAVMNEAEPSAADVGAFEQGLKSKTIKVLIYNAQTSGQMSRRLLSIARTAGVPVVPVSETQPAGMRYPQWMLDQLDRLDQALAHPPAQ
ncbi:zinc ABC transporter substrate-binding protein [Robbsia sp. Bb-Pol-6]|uniref:Zinc ABC transporter substrate-binding protein n=1 Tax=Robbsia betulipollinis TaxID=2981849 RepID=A0ABT3ZLV5_9BURK|nr:zinc ABC transporter substrate-binding protein [Robbsia betulipollinis]MCY0387524.1 zinc ABC transporter substrate-binding protein [Robbsia betulipollinis]